MVCMKSYRRFKPHLVMVLVQFGYTFMFFITEAAFNHGLNPHVLVTYRNIVAGIVLLPLAYFLERNSRPKITASLSVQLFIFALIGLGLTPNMYFASLRYTSPTFVASIYNSVACLTFVMAVILRLEILDLRNPRGISKIIGTLFSLSGAMIMSLYKGPILKNISHPLFHLEKHETNHENWFKGSVLAVMSCIGCSWWYIMQAYIVKKYPAQVSLTTIVNLIGAAQSAVLTVILEHNRATWTIGFNISLWAIIYSGVVASALIILCQLWCMKEKGPVFVATFNPLSTLLAALLAYFVLGENLYLGSMIGGIIVITGLYLLLWGKEGDQASQHQVQVDKTLSTHPVAFENGEDHAEPRIFLSVAATTFPTTQKSS